MLPYYKHKMLFGVLFNYSLFFMHFA